MKILVAGNSVPLRIRPALTSPSDKCYAGHLQDLLPNSTISLRAKGASTITDLTFETDELTSNQAQVYILNFGIVDACTRPLGRKLYTWITKPGKPGLIRKLAKGLEAKFRRQLVRLRGKNSWVSATEFLNSLSFIHESLKKDLAPQFIVIGINHCNQRIEQQLPGSQRNIEKFNALIQSYCDNQNDCKFLDPNLINPRLEIPDGIHYSAKDHALIAEKLISLIHG